MPKKFQLTNLRGFKGFIQKRDRTNVGANYLVKGSQNVVSTDEGRVAIRKGYTLDGAANSSLTEIESSFVWLTKRGLEVPLRSYDDELEIRYSGDWIRLEDGWTDVDFNYTTYWDTTELQDALLFVNGDSNIYYWSGGITTFASVTVNTITKQGTTSWTEEGFLTAGTRQVIIEGTTYTYTGGETTTTLTGVTPDPTVAGHTVGAVVVQAVRTQANTPASGFNNDLIATIRNQVYVGDTTRRDVFVSAVSDYTDYTFSSPRLVGEGALLNIDETPTAFVEQEENMYISTKNQWYNTRFELSSDLQNETLLIQRLKTSPLQGAINQSSVFKIKNDVIFLDGEPTIDSLGRIENVDTPQNLDISDPIKLYLQSLDTTNAAGIYWQNNFYMSIPNESVVLIYNIEKGYWEAPQILPISRFSIIDEHLYGHSNVVPETYKLFDDVYSDNNNAINAIAKFSYRNYGLRAWQKNLTEWFTEGYIAENTEINLQLNYDYEGFERQQEFTIDGDDDTILFQPIADNSLGKNSLGKEPLGTTKDELEELSKFRQIDTTYKTDFYEIQAIYSSNDIDQRWEILAFGGDIVASTSDNNHIKK